MSRPLRGDTAWFRIADGLLGVDSDDPGLLFDLESRYGDCRVAAPPPGLPIVRCRVGLVDERGSLALTFIDGAAPDPLAVLQRMFLPARVRDGYVLAPYEEPVWQLVVNGEHEGRPFVAYSEHTLLLDPTEAPYDFVLEYLVCAVQSVQPSILFVHGASIGFGEAGGLFIGRTKTGKSTLALACARRGASFLGDELAAVRVGERTLVPMRRAAGVRNGPLADEIGDQLATCQYVTEVPPDGLPRKLVRVSELFPSEQVGPVRLRDVFFLDGFASEPRVTPYDPSLTDLERLQSTTARWEPTPGQELMRLLVVLDVLKDVRCHLLDVGSPGDTAVMIEDVMMERAWV